VVWSIVLLAMELCVLHYCLMVRLCDSHGSRCALRKLFAGVMRIRARLDLDLHGVVMRLSSIFIATVGRVAEQFRSLRVFGAIVSIFSKIRGP
jgi:hypothetical protein